MINPLVSIIIPIYNLEQYLEECLESCINQTYENIEVICVNDGSIDGTKEISKKFIKDERIKWFDKLNGGLSSARNYGLDRCKGEYIFFLDGDDVIHIKTIEIFVNSIRDCDVIQCKILSFTDLKLDNRNSNFDLSENKIVTKTEATYQLLKKGDLDISVICNKMYKKNIWFNLRFPDNYLHEDQAVNYLVYDKIETMCVIPIKLYYYRQREGSIMSKHNPKKTYDLLNILSKREAYYKENKEFIFAKLSEVVYLNVLLKAFYIYKNDYKTRLKLMDILDNRRHIFIENIYISKFQRIVLFIYKFNNGLLNLYGYLNN